jgi:glutaredoxin
MVTAEHICPFGLKSKYLLRQRGFSVDDHELTTRAATDKFMEDTGVETTPQTYIGGIRVGGYDDLRKYFGLKVRDKDQTTYQPVVAVFAMCALMAIAISWAAFGDLLTIRAVEWFISLSMCVLAIQKLQDLESFSNRFITYDLLGMKWIPYSYIYPFGEALAGVLMVAGALPWISSPVAIFIGSVGAVSVFKAVFIERRALKCACVGGSSNVPLGAVSLTENLMMVAMGVWMLIRIYQ